MKRWATLIYAYYYGEVRTFQGPIMQTEQNDMDEAQEWLDSNGLGYLVIEGEYTGEKVHIEKFQLN